MSNLIIIAEERSTNTVYNHKRRQAKVDLVIKYIFLTVIVLTNLAALSTAFAYITMYCPINTQPLFTTSFIVGVIGGMISLKIPTFGVTNYNLSQYLNPVTLIGRGMAYLFFGPTLLAKEKLDWTNYADPMTADQISGELSSKTFRAIADIYGSHFSNLIKYGFIDQDKQETIEQMYTSYIRLKMRRERIATPLKIIETPSEDERSNNPLLIEDADIEREIHTLDDQWNSLKESMSEFPHPELNTPDFSRRHVRWYHIVKQRLFMQTRAA